MKLKLIALSGLALLTISRILLAQGFDFLQAQKPLDYTHWLMMLGAIFTLPFYDIFPKKFIHYLASFLAVLGVVAHIGMCAIDFALWSFADDHETRNKLISHLSQVPSVWLPFMTIGPAFLYMGLATHAWRFVLSHPVGAMLTLGGSAMIGIGQVILNDMVLFAIGTAVFSTGLGLLAFRKEGDEKISIAAQLKKNLPYMAGTMILLTGIWYTYSMINQRIEAEKRRKWVASLPHTASPNVQILTDTITIDYLNEKRTLAIYLPENYENDSVDYPVIYFLDGQSLFDEKIQEGTEWQVDEVLDSLANMGGEKAIVVGIYNSEDRMTEYKPFPSTRWYSDKTVSGDKHAEWIVNHLKPWVDAKFRTQQKPESTIIGGASLGGLMSYYMLMTYPEVFGGGIVFSPSFWVSEKVYGLHESNPNMVNQKIYFNSGQLETPTAESIQRMHDILFQAGMPSENMRLDIEEGEGHWHMAWRKGFRKVYPWIVSE